MGVASVWSYVGRLVGWSARAHARPPASVIVPLRVRDRNVHLVFGMQWHTILGTDLSLQARRKARAVGAVYWVHAGGRSESVGTVHLTAAAGIGTRRGWRGEAHSAAQIVATRHPTGTHAWVQMLPDGRYWVVIVRNGQVLNRGDVVVDDLVAARACIEQAQERFGSELNLLEDTPELVAHASSPHASSQRDEERARAMLTRLLRDAGPRTLVQKSPVGVRVPAVMGVLALASATVFWLQRQPDGPAGVHIGHTHHSVQVDERQAETLWLQAFHDALQEHALPTHEGLGNLWQRIVQMPVRRRGWRLGHVHCQARGDLWHCRATYVRDDLRASAGALTGPDLPSAQLRWTSLDEAVAHFEVEVQRHPIDLHALRETAPGMIIDADALQALRPLLGSIRIDAPRPIPMIPPRTGEGLVPPRPRTLPQLQARSVTLQGPMRFVALLGPELTRRIKWEEVNVQLSPGVRPGLRASALTATLRGRVIEWRAPDEADDAETFSS